MLTAKENLVATITNGKPDRYSNNYEALALMFHPWGARRKPAELGGPSVVDQWGVSWIWPEGTPGAFPIHDDEHLVLKDITEWKEYVKAPALDFSEAEWDVWRQMYRDFDRSSAICASFVAPGLFEQTHHLGSITEMLMASITDTDEYIELVKYLTEFELQLAEGICENLKPEAIFHHDDWGSQDNSFLRPELFDEIFLEPYKAIYGYYKDHGVKYIFHHSDSYAANLVPEMIEMGIDVWQGPMHTNNVAELVQKYGDKISFMGNIDNRFVDFDGFTPEDVKKAAYDCTLGEGLTPEHYIPCITQGGPGSTFPGAYAELVKQIDLLNSEQFGFSVEEIEAARPPITIMF